MDASENGVSKKSYAELVAEGICTHCGKPNPTPGKGFCPDCWEKEKKRRKLVKEYLKKRGICVSCGKNPAEPNRVQCMECAGKRMDRYYEQGGNTDKQRERNREYWREKSKQRRADGVCIRCGKRKPEEGKATCRHCLNKNKLYKERHREKVIRSQRTLYGLCYICGKPALPNMGVCKDCYETRLKMVKPMLDNPDHGYWSKLIAAEVAEKNERKRISETCKQD